MYDDAVQSQELVVFDGGAHHLDGVLSLNVFVSVVLHRRMFDCSGVRQPYRNLEGDCVFFNSFNSVACQCQLNFVFVFVFVFYDPICGLSLMKMDFAYSAFFCVRSTIEISETMTSNHWMEETCVATCC